MSLASSVQRAAERAIDARMFPGCAIGVVRMDGSREMHTFGRLTYEHSSLCVREDTIYDLASVTKSIPLASLAALFVAQEKLKLDDKVVYHIPELQNDFDATIEDLLRYRVCGPRMSTLDASTSEQVRAHIFERGFDGPPGESEYSNLPAFLLGIVLERVGDEILPVLAHDHFFGPLNMSNTAFFPSDIERVAPTEIVGRQEIRGIVHDESARLFAIERQAVAHAGLFSTVPDMLTFLEALLQGKWPTVVDFAQRGFGWQRQGDLLGGSRDDSLRFGKTGFTGTSVALDLQRGIGLVILSNRTYPHRPTDSSAINAFRKEIADTVFSS